jgi:predicted ArsR family transcriptional regulator
MSERANKKRKEDRDKILNLLKERGRMCTKEIAGAVGMSSPTASKHLAGLEGEKKVIRHDDQPPYIYWTLNNDSNEEQNS